MSPVARRRELFLPFLHGLHLNPAAIQSGRETRNHKPWNDMNWFYTDNNEQRGPVSESEFDFLVRAGKIKPDTLVWREGMAGWQPWSEVAPPPPADAVPPPVGGVLQASGAPVDSADRNGPSWEQRETLGIFAAAIKTFRAVLLEPTETFAQMKREGEISSSLTYLLLVGGVGWYIFSVYQAVFLHFGLNIPDFSEVLLQKIMRDVLELKNLPLQATTPDSSQHGGWILTFSLLRALFIVPINLTLTAFIGSGILHVILILLGGAKQSFKTTFRVVCYSTGSAAVLLIIPALGSSVCFVWRTVVTTIGLAKAHEISIGKAAVAVLVPLFFCFGTLISLLLAFSQYERLHP